METTGADFEWPSTNIQPQGTQSKNHDWTARGPQRRSEANAMSWKVGTGEDPGSWRAKEAVAVGRGHF